MLIKMHSLLRITAAICVLASNCPAEIDLTPLKVSVGGGLMQRTHFRDGEKKYAVPVDALTEVFAGSRSAIFRFKDINMASVKFLNSPVRERLAFDATGIPGYVKAAQSLLPAAAESVAVEEQVPDVLPINAWQSFHVVFSYTIASEKYRESITFLNLDGKQQIVIQAGAKEPDFAAVAGRADHLMRRWHEVLPGDETGDN